MKKMITKCIGVSLVAVLLCGGVFAGDAGTVKVTGEIKVQQANPQGVDKLIAAVQELVDMFKAEEADQLAKAMKRYYSAEDDITRLEFAIDVAGQARNMLACGMINNQPMSAREAEIKAQALLNALEEVIKQAEAIKTTTSIHITEQRCVDVDFYAKKREADFTLLLKKDKTSADDMMVELWADKYLDGVANQATSASIAAVNSRVDETQSYLDGHYLLKEDDIITISTKGGKLYATYEARFGTYTEPVTVNESTRSKDGKLWIITFTRSGDRGMALQQITAEVPMAEARKNGVAQATVTNCKLIKAEDPKAAACDPLNALGIAKEAKEAANGAQGTADKALGLAKSNNEVIGVVANEVEDAQSRLDYLRQQNVKKNRWGYKSYIPMNRYIPTRANANQ